MHVMIDLETFGNLPGCAIASIGAVIFNPTYKDNNALGPTFYRVVDLVSCERAGLKIDANTVYWWMTQSDEAKGALTKDRTPLTEVLLDFQKFILGAKRFYGDESEAVYLWCHGATFDEPILKAAYRALALQEPWDFRDVRDTRTLYDLAKVKAHRSEGTHHHALDDAKAQALGVAEGYAKLGLAFRG